MLSKTERNALFWLINEYAYFIDEANDNLQYAGR